MTISVQGTRNGAALNSTIAFSLIYASSTTYKVNATYIQNGVPSTATMWILKSGVVEAMYVGLDDGQTRDHNYTNSNAVTNYLVNLLAPVATYDQFGTELTSYSSYFQSTGTSSMTISENTFTVTNYTSVSPNVAIPSCGGYTYALNTYKLSVGTPTGSDYEIVPYMEIAGSSTSSSGTNTFDYTIQITSLAVG